jgi:hypothetical protein
MVVSERMACGMIASATTPTPGSEAVLLVRDFVNPILELDYSPNPVARALRNGEFGGSDTSTRG